ncbi:PDR/VanB family oxidoreductase [uncultured Arthrobacter sp.]|uniref:PDR/VanB family oxidoreductase n=1 Tax=uncultured Arthrobacter sp. TaxID=114050 RepID=UPI002611FBFC|nr:PDR/VanB family oxidoreductase [uncultured Arthrobacter sp.]
MGTVPTAGLHLGPPGAGGADDGYTEVVIDEIRPESDRVVSVHLRPRTEGGLPSWTPGSHVDVLLPNGLLRQYSLCSEPGAGTWRLGVLREASGRGGSAYIHEGLRPGDSVRVRSPRNNFELLPAPEYLFVAGGIGITPLLPMIARAEEEGIPWRLVYLGRSLASMAFRSELERYGDKVQLHANDTSGRYPLPELFGTGVGGFHAYVCGPATLLDQIASLAGTWDDRTRFHFERFVAAQDPVAVEDEHEFTVETTGGVEVQVPVGISILDALAEAGVPALNSCRGGICGTCETAVVSGEIDHRDSLLTPEEQDAGDTMMICVSRCRGSRLVLDV